MNSYVTAMPMPQVPMVDPKTGVLADVWFRWMTTIFGRTGGAQGAAPAAQPSTLLPLMDGSAAVGTEARYAHGDHVHPIDTSRYAASNPAGFQTAADVTASLLPYALLASTGTYTFTQNTPLATWTITHNLGKFPSAVVVDSAGNVVEGDIDYVSANQVVISFTGAFSGEAYLN